MTISRKQFRSYVAVQESGVTNMFNVKLVGELSGLSRHQILHIMENYHDLVLEYGEK